MKIFFYKTLLVFVFLFVLIQFTIGSLVNDLREEAFNLKSKKNIEYVKEKVRKEKVRKGLLKPNKIERVAAKIKKKIKKKKKTMSVAQLRKAGKIQF